MRRVSVVGNSGSGKTTVARLLATRLGLPYLELDAVFHQPGWQELPVDEFRDRVASFVAGDEWLVDGNYTAVRDLVWARADTVVWLDPPRSVVMRRLVTRTLRRFVLREELWNGNREPWSNFWRRDPQRSILAWAWTMHETYRNRYASAMADAQNSHLHFVVVRSRRDVDELVDRAQPPGATRRSC